MGSWEAEMDIEAERDTRKRPREAEEPATAGAPEPATAGAPELSTPVPSCPLVAAALRLRAHARLFATETSEYYKHVLANPLNIEQVREQEEKIHNESWERFHDNFDWADENNPFESLSKIPCMRFTHEDFRRPNYPHTLITEDTLQIVSIQVKDISGGLEWPLDVYGLIAVRDVQDRRRRIMVFNRERNDYQRIDEEDSYLTLTGPTRGVVMTVDPSYLEVLLKVRGGASESEDKYLSKFARQYSLGCSKPIKYTSKLCTLEMQYYTVEDAVEATISVRVAEGQWPRGFRGVLTARTKRHSDVEISLLELNDDVLPLDDDGLIKLSRRVVCVGRGRKLHVSVVQPGIGEEEEDQLSAVTSFIAMEAKTSTSLMPMKTCSCSLEVTVAWSLFSVW